jgi:hypothetical protein
MTDLDTDLLRRALRASPEPERAFDSAAIITRGRRLRWRRRATAVGGGVCLAAAVFGAVTGVGRLTAPSPGPGHHTVAPVGPAGVSTRPRPVPSPIRDRTTPSPSASTSPTAIPTRRAQSSSTPVSASAGGPTPSTSPTSPDSGMTAPSAGATSASIDQPSATPTATQ